MSDDLVRPEIKGIKEYVPGKTPVKPGVIKLASNENPFGPSPKAIESIVKESLKLQIYPDQRSSLLRDALSKKLALPADNFICGNGSDDIMQIIGATYLNPGDEVIISKNTFSLYELIARIFGGKLVFVDLRDFALDLPGIAAAITTKTKIIFLTNPNNPTGSIFTSDQLEAFMKKVPDGVLVVVDEAYGEFVEDKYYPVSLKYVREERDIIVLRTFSKYYGLAGLRVGYGIARKELIAPMLLSKMPFNVSRLGQAGAVAALEDKAFLEKTLKNNSEGRKYLYSEFDKLGLDYKKTESNFIFINLKKSADEFFLKMMADGVILRPLTSFGFPEAVRISIGTPEQNKKLVEALKKVLK